MFARQRPRLPHGLRPPRPREPERACGSVTRARSGRLRRGDYCWPMVGYADVTARPNIATIPRESRVRRKGDDPRLGPCFIGGRVSFAVCEKAGPRNLIETPVEILRKQPAASMQWCGSGHAEPRNAAHGAAAMAASAISGIDVASCVYKADTGSIMIP